MDSMRFIYDAPAILIKKTLIVGDTHFGMEQKLQKKGIYDENFSRKLVDRLISIIKQHKAEKVILLGDVKESITVLDKKTEDALNRLADVCEIIIVRGNHDGGIEKFKRATIYPSDGFVYENLGLLHGHSYPSDELLMCDYLVMGHQHPLIRIADSFGKVHSEPVWIFAENNGNKLKEHYKRFNKKIKLILMPAFNPLVGFPIKLTKKDALGPLFNKNLFKLDDALLFRLDGTRLGNFKQIKNQKS